MNGQQRINPLMTATMAPSNPVWNRSFAFGCTSLLVATLGVIFALIPMFALAAVIHGSLAIGFGAPSMTKNYGLPMGIIGALLGVAALAVGTISLVLV